QTDPGRRSEVNQCRSHERSSSTRARLNDRGSMNHAEQRNGEDDVYQCEGDITPTVAKDFDEVVDQRQTEAIVWRCLPDDGAPEKGPVDRAHFEEDTRFESPVRE